MASKRALEIQIVALKSSIELQRKQTNDLQTANEKRFREIWEINHRLHNENQSLRFHLTQTEQSIARTRREKEGAMLAAVLEDTDE